MSSGTSADRRAGVPWGLIARLSLSYGLAYSLCSSGAATFVNLYVTRGLGYPVVTWASLSLAFTLANVAGSLLTGVVVSRFGSRRTLVICLLAASAGYGVFAVAKRLLLIELGLVLCGCAIGMADTAHISMLLCAVPEAQGRAIAARTVIGGLIGMPLLVLWGRSFDRIGYGWTFIIGAVLLLASAPAFWALTSTVSERVEVTSEQGFLQMARADWRGFLSPHLLIILVFGALMEPWMARTRIQLSANLFSTAYGMDERVIGQIVGLSGLVMVVGCLTLGMLFQRTTPHRRWGLAMMLAGGCLAGMGLVSRGYLAAGLLTIHQLVYTVAMCSAGVAIADAGAPNHRVLALSVGSAVYFAGMLSAGLAHRLMLGAGITVSQVFIICGGVGMLGGLPLALRRWSRGETAHGNPSAPS